jgi:hypothetical protein
MRRLLAWDVLVQEGARKRRAQPADDDDGRRCSPRRARLCWASVRVPARYPIRPTRYSIASEWEAAKQQALPADDTRPSTRESILNPRKCEFSRSMVGSAGTRQPAESRSQACRRACPAHDAGEHLRPRLHTANSLSAVLVRGRRAVVKDVGVRPPNDGQAAADDARPRPPENATLTLPQRRCTSCV